MRYLVYRTGTEVIVGLNYRKSFKVAPGVRVTASKSGIGYSVGVRGARVTKRARGGYQTTLRVPGTGVSYTSRVSGTKRSGSTSPSIRLTAEANRRAALAVPTPRNVKVERYMLLAGFVFLLLTPAFVPIVLLSVVCLVVSLVLMVKNLKRNLAWARRLKAARAQAHVELLSGPVA